MKEPQGGTAAQDLALLSATTQCEYRDSPSSRGTGSSLLLLQLRTELEGKWRPDKLGILRRWMNVSPKHWFCQKEDVQDYAMRPAMIVKSTRKSNGPKHPRRKQRTRNLPISKSLLVERFAQETPGNEENDSFVDCRVDGEFPSEQFVSDQDRRRIKRFLLEEEVMVLQKLLQRETDVHAALQSVACPTSCGAPPQFPADLPASTLSLLQEIVALEKEVAKLEEKSLSLQYQIAHGRPGCDYLEGRDTEACQSSSLGVGSVVKYSSRRMASSMAERPNHSHSIARKETSGVTFGDHLRCTSSSVHAQNSSPDAHSATCTSTDLGSQSAVGTKSVSTMQPLKSRTSRQSTLTWKSRESGTTNDRAVSTASNSNSRYSLSSCSHNIEPSSAGFEESPISLACSPSRCSNSGASTSDQSGSCGAGGGDQDLGSASPSMSLFFTLPTSPTSPEHRARPTSPVGPADFRLLRNAQAEPCLRRLPRFARTPENSGVWNVSEEFYTPKTSSTSADHHSGESQPSSTEKPRSKVRLKLDLGAAEDNFKIPNALYKIYDPGNGASRSLIRDLLSPTDLDILSPRGEDDRKQVRDYSSTPNLLSEEMVKCMISIYCLLADPALINMNRTTYDTVPSPNSHFGHTTLSSFSSTSESSLLSFVRSPLVDLRNKDDVLGCESSPDPYKVRGKLPWADVGVYSKVLEVPWMAVSKDQLGYAAQALYKFRLLVEQLARVNPRTLSHSEKLAFWLNLYNALMMHAYLAYGIPRNDLKYFALLQKAAYNVGGQTINAATMEFFLLRGKCPSYRPQIGLLLALHRTKFTLTEEQSKYAIDYPEPQMVFALCSGARSCPAVRVYTAAHVHMELNLALRDYTRATVGMNAKGKLLVPKLLYTYAHDFVEDYAFLDWICQLLPANQAGLVQECWQHRQNRLLGARRFTVLPFEFNFRYLFSPIVDS